ncbi:hypothetical protein V8E36_004220 [Tilletia maclaganii]
MNGTEAQLDGPRRYLVSFYIPIVRVLGPLLALFLCIHTIHSSPCSTSSAAPTAGSARNDHKGLRSRSRSDKTGHGTPRSSALTLSFRSSNPVAVTRLSCLL